MALVVESVDGKQERRNLHASLPDWFSIEAACRPDVTWPSIEQVLTAERMYLARNDGEPVCVVLTRGKGKIDWLYGRPQWVFRAGSAIIDRVCNDAGACWGVVSNAAVRNGLVAHNRHLVSERGTRLLRYVP